MSSLQPTSPADSGDRPQRPTTAPNGEPDARAGQTATAVTPSAPHGVPAGRPASRSLPRRVSAPVGLLAAAAGAFAYVGSVDPNHPGHYPVCPFLYLTGWYCPACGGLRSAYAVVHGDFGGALRDNALAVVGYGIAAVLWALWLSREVRGRPAALRVPRAVWWGLGAVVLVFSVVRNLWFGAFLAP
ncbi:DUF2752 domain-containing protein [Streptomyces sp. NPDC054933]